MGRHALTAVLCGPKVPPSVQIASRGTARPADLPGITFALQLQMTENASPFATRCVRAGRTPDPAFGSVVPPLYQTTTFAQSGLGGDRGFTYSRAGNPTVSALEEALGALESAPAAVCQKSGMAAITVLFLSILEGGDRLAIGRTVYGGTVRLAREILDPLGVETTFFDPENPEEFAAVLEAAPRLVFLESPANPTLDPVDIARISRAAKAAGALVAVDNTFQTPVGQSPLELGADVSVYSTTKFIEGHNATLGGSLVSRSGPLIERFRRLTKSLGCTQAPFDAWLTLRGLTTLPLRFEQHSKSAQRVAEALESLSIGPAPRAAGVRYPGLDSFPGRELADKQHRDGPSGKLHGGIVTFEVPGGFGPACAFLRNLEFVMVAENLGAPESLATHPASMTHPDVPLEQRQAAGITDGLVRLSIGLEDPADVIADLTQALTAAAASLDGQRDGSPERTEVPA